MMKITRTELSEMIKKEVMKLFEEKKVEEKREYGSPFGKLTYMNAMKESYMWGMIEATKDKMLISEGIDWNNSVRVNEGVDLATEKEMLDKKGGIIVFSTDVNAVELSPNRVVNWLKQKFTTLRNRMQSTSKIDKYGKKYNLAGWTVGHYLDGRYTDKNGNFYGENSLSVEIIGVSTDEMISIAEDICREFNQESVILKDYTSHRILFIDPS